MTYWPCWRPLFPAGNSNVAFHFSQLLEKAVQAQHKIIKILLLPILWACAPDSMQFEYEIPVDEYVASQVLYFQLSTGRKRIRSGLAWILEGAILIFVALNGDVLNWPKILLLPIGAWSI